MRVLYAIQGTGNGHISRAMEIVPLLKERAKTDVLISGIASDLELPFDVKYRNYGLSFIFGKRGGIDLLATYKKSRLKNLMQEIRELPVYKYDLVISDFEPVSAWAARKRKVPSAGLSNQVAVMSEGAPQPLKIDPIGKMVLRHYAPCDREFGFHFKRYNNNIYTPIIRKEIRNAQWSKDGHYTVYLPSYDDARILKRLKKFPDVKWHVFSKHSKKKYKDDNVVVRPISNEAFLDSFVHCDGIITGAGFGAPGEALLMGKKLMVVPMKQQYEQQCNAAALRDMGVTVISSLKKKHHETISSWLETDRIVPVEYPDETAMILDRILSGK
jgi:uncharacterized protein (TIGR00661 family)